MIHEDCDHGDTIFKIMKTLHNSPSTKMTSWSMMMMRMTMIMDTMFMMIKSLHNRCVLLHRGDIMIHYEYADDFSDMVFMMFMMMITLHNLVYASFTSNVTPCWWWGWSISKPDFSSSSFEVDAILICDWMNQAIEWPIPFDYQRRRKRTISSHHRKSSLFKIITELT